MNFLSPSFSPAHVAGMGCLALAYVGDAVYEAMVRTYLCEQGLTTHTRLHKAAVSHVRAQAQASAAQDLQPYLTEEEQAVLLRGRNTQVASLPKTASRSQYQWATALEVLWGHLYLSGQRQRLCELFARIHAPRDSQS